MNFNRTNIEKNFRKSLFAKLTVHLAEDEYNPQYSFKLKYSIEKISNYDPHKMNSEFYVNYDKKAKCFYEESHNWFINVLEQLKIPFSIVDNILLIDEKYTVWYTKNPNSRNAI